MKRLLCLTVAALTAVWASLRPPHQKSRKWKMPIKTSSTSPTSGRCCSGCT